MQEDKELAFDAFDTAKGCIALFTGMIDTMKFKSKDEIKKIEEAYAKTETPVVSNNSAHTDGLLMYRWLYLKSIHSTWRGYQISERTSRNKERLCSG